MNHKELFTREEVVNIIKKIYTEQYKNPIYKSAKKVAGGKKEIMIHILTSATMFEIDLLEDNHEAIETE